jgi:long-subunit acyl-CoA synthetase (AMP-forming)
LLDNKINDKIAPTVQEIEAKPIPLPVQPAIKIIPDEKLVQDLMNMGFSKEESEAALIDVKNASIELAVNKVFENKAKFDEQNDFLGEEMQKSIHDYAKEQDIEEQKKKEQEEIERQQKEVERLEKLNKFKQDKNEEIEAIQNKIKKISKMIETLEETKINGF